MLSFTIAACEGDNDNNNSGVNNEQPGKLPNEDVDGTPDDDMGKPNEDLGGNNNEGGDEGNDGGNDGGNEGSDEGSDEGNDGGEEEVLDATYIFKDDLRAIVRPMETNGLRNDYLEFLDNTTGHALYIDLYSPLDGEYLPTGTYPLGDGSLMTSDQQYTYILLSGYADFIRITEGSATVTATRDEATGVVTHSVKANYTMTTGDTIALRYTGTFEIKIE